jgi:peptidoglycan/LPS O-acetylase OafA/YrhL
MHTTRLPNGECGCLRMSTIFFIGGNHDGGNMNAAAQKGSAQKRGFNIPSLDGLRAVAILLVFWGHSEHLPKFVEPGVGVTVFFFLSGYLITTLLRLEWTKYGRVSLKKFYLRRILKIFPPMYFILIFGIAVTSTGVLPSDLSLGGIAAAATQVSNYWIILFDSGIPTSLRVLWSLAVEEHFSLAIPLIYIALRRTRLRTLHQVYILAGMAGLVLAWRCYLWFIGGVNFDRIYLGTDTRLDSILWGCIFAISLNPVLDKAFFPDWFWKWIAVPLGLVLTVLGTKGYDLAPTIGYTMQALGMALVFTAVIRFPTFWAFRWLNWKPVVWYGVISYCFYLCHRYFILWFYDHLDISPWISFVLAAGGATLMAWGMHVWIERPAAKMRHRLSRSNEVSDDDRAAASARL